MQCFLTCQYFSSSSFYMFGLFSVHFPLKLFFIRRFLKSPNLNETFWPIVRPTNGAFTLFLALHTCDTVSYYHLYISLWESQISKHTIQILTGTEPQSSSFITRNYLTHNFANWIKLNITYFKHISTNATLFA